MCRFTAPWGLCLPNAGLVHLVAIRLLEGGWRVELGVSRTVWCRILSSCKLREILR